MCIIYSYFIAITTMLKNQSWWKSSSSTALIDETISLSSLVGLSLFDDLQQLRFGVLCCGSTLLRLRIALSPPQFVSSLPHVAFLSRVSVVVLPSASLSSSLPLSCCLLPAPFASLSSSVLTPPPWREAVAAMVSFETLAIVSLFYFFCFNKNRKIFI